MTATRAFDLAQFIPPIDPDNVQDGVVVTTVGPPFLTQYATMALAGKVGVTVGTTVPAPTAPGQVLTSDASGNWTAATSSSSLPSPTQPGEILVSGPAPDYFWTVQPAPVPVVPASTNPAMDGVAAPGVSAAYARADHVHPTDTSLYPVSNPAGYQTAAQIAVPDNLRVLKGGDTMTGPLVLPAGTVTATALNFGTPGTGIYTVNGVSRIDFAAAGVNKLTISSGNVISAVQIQNAAGAAAAPGYSFSGFLTNGFYRSGTNQVSVSTNGIETMRWNADNSTTALGPILLPADPTLPLQACTKQYADGKAYTLPVASTTVLGGVKVDGTTITATAGGVISTAITPYILPTASTTVLGGVKVDGTSVSINGSGVISAATPPGMLTDAPNDGNQYGRQSAAWVQVPPAGASQTYVDAADSARVLKGGDTMTGALTMPLGSASAAAINFGTPGTGIYSAVSSTQINVTVAGIVRYTLSSASFTSTLPINAATGTAAAPGYRFTANLTSGFYSNGTNQISVSNNSLETMRWGADNSTTLLGKLVTPATTAASAPIILPHGTAPTTPANGDLWSTTAGFFGRVNGVTIGPFGTAGSGGIADAPNDGQTYGRKSLGWVALSGSGGVPEAPTDGGLYSRFNSTWSDLNPVLATKLNTSAYTAADVLAKLVTVDGTGSGLDADTIDGMDSTAFTAADALRVLKSGDGMTGPLVMPSGTAAATSINFGTPGTGIWSSAPATSLNFSIAGVQKLSVVSGFVTGAVPFSAPAGTVSAPGYCFSGTAAVGLSRSGTNQVSISTVGETMRWNADNSTTALGPILLPADPTLPLQACTKQYADGKAYTLPTASTTVLGGVKVDGTSITIAAGVISTVLGDAPSDGTGYLRQSGTWTNVLDAGTF